MKKILVFMLLLGSFMSLTAVDGLPEFEELPDVKEELVLEKDRSMRISVTAQGVAPRNTISPAQAYVMAKRAATVEAYRLIGERMNGVRVEGQDTIKNMVVQRSTVRAQVSAMIKNATIVETTYKEGICEVEMEIEINYNQF